MDLTPNHHGSPRGVAHAGARAVLQFYPEEPAHLEMLRNAALEAEFTGGLVVDYPRSERSKKLYLVLTAPPAPPPRPSQQLSGMKHVRDTGPGQWHEGSGGGRRQPRPSNRREKGSKDGGAGGRSKKSFKRH